MLVKRAMSPDEAHAGARWARKVAAVIAGGLLALGGGGFAHAADPAHGTLGYPDGKDGGVKVINAKATDSKRAVESARRLSLTIGDKTVLAYCIDHGHGIDPLAYQEAPWSAANPSKDQLAKIQWVLTNGYPTVGVDALIQSAQATRPANTANLEKLVYAGTQAAIWTLSDPQLFELRASKDGYNLQPNSGADEYALIVAISKYLLNGATGTHEDPQPKLAIQPGTLTGQAGKKIGPFTVSSGGGEATLSATGGKLVDKDGNPVTKLANGGQFYVVGEAPGTITVEAKGSGSVPIGRVFTTVSNPNKYQKLILAGVAGTELEAEATVTVTPAVPTLPVTGMKLTAAIAAGLLFVGGGALLLVTIRKRRIQFTA